MRIPDELFKKWGALRSHGDGKKIYDQTGLSQAEVSKAFKSQECTDETFEKLANYFQSKEEKIKEYL